MSMETLSLKLSSDLIQEMKKILGSSGTLDAFITDAIVNEIQRRYTSESQSDFWETVAQIQAEMQAEELELDPDAIWEDVRDPSPGREVVL